MAGLDPAILFAAAAPIVERGASARRTPRSNVHPRRRSQQEDGRIKHALGHLTRGSGHDVERTARPAKAFAADSLILMRMGLVPAIRRGTVLEWMAGMIPGTSPGTAMTMRS